MQVSELLKRLSEKYALYGDTALYVYQGNEPFEHDVSLKAGLKIVLRSRRDKVQKKHVSSADLAGLIELLSVCDSRKEISMKLYGDQLELPIRIGFFAYFEGFIELVSHAEL